MSNGTALATTLADDPSVQKTALFSQGNLGRKRLKSEPPAKLIWQEVNEVTWRLIDPDAPQARVETSHGQWGGYHYPKALAYVFDVGTGRHDWRIRVRRRGKWRAFGCMVDLPTAKRVAQETLRWPNSSTAPNTR
jgi:hypothetical protein